jgi:magnesium chelatase accessory protein
MRWPRDAAGWPMADLSRIVLHRPHRWHVQEGGTGETLLLIHGAGGATMSFRGLMPILMQTHHVVAVDLPGLGFTQSGARQRSGLDPMAEDLLSLMRQQGWQPCAIIGHSAGAAIALRMAELGAVPQGQVIGINAALSNFKGMAGWLFPAMAKALALAPFTASLFAGTMTEAKVRNLIKGTGSVLDDAGIALYLRLASDRGHVDATLSMMAQWTLDGLLARMPAFPRPVTLLVGDKDTAVPPQSSRDAARILPDARVLELPGLGHLAHEEDAARVAQVILSALTAD